MSDAAGRARYGGLRLRTLLLGLAIFLYLPLVYHYGVALQAGESVDFPSYYHAARLTFAEHRSPYGAAAFEQISEQLGRKVHPFLYPPPSLLALWPLAQWSLAASHRWFLAASHLALLGSCWLLLRRLVPWPEKRKSRERYLLLAVLYLLLFDPMVVTLALGQINLIVLFFLLLALAGMKNHSAAWQIALPLSVAIVLKTYPLLLLAPLFFHKRYAAILQTLLCLATLVGLAAWLLPPAVWSDWAQNVLPMGAYGQDAGSASGPWNQNLNALVLRLLVPHALSDTPLPWPALAPKLAAGLVAAVLAATAYCSYWRSRQADAPQKWESEMAAWLLALFLIAPLSWEHHLVYILPAALLALRRLVCGEHSAGVAMVLLAALLVIGRRIPFWDAALTHGWWTLLISAKCYAVFVLWLFFLADLHPLRRRDAQPGMTLGF